MIPLPCPPYFLLGDHSLAVDAWMKKISVAPGQSLECDNQKQTAGRQGLLLLLPLLLGSLKKKEIRLGCRKINYREEENNMKAL